MRSAKNSMIHRRCGRLKHFYVPRPRPAGTLCLLRRPGILLPERDHGTQEPQSPTPHHAPMVSISSILLDAPKSASFTSPVLSTCASGPAKMSVVGKLQRAGTSAGWSMRPVGCPCVSCMPPEPQHTLPRHPCWAHQDVGALDVPVHDAVAVQVLQPQQDLLGVHLDHALPEAACKGGRRVLGGAWVGGWRW